MPKKSGSATKSTATTVVPTTPDESSREEKKKSPQPSSTSSGGPAPSSASLFDCKPLCTALRMRWRHPSYRHKVGEVLTLLEEHRVEVASSWRRKFPHPPNDDDLDGLLGSNSDDEEQGEGGDRTRVKEGDVCESSIRSDMSTSSRSTTGSRRPMTISTLQRFVFQAVDDVKSNLPEQPWHKALRFISFDLPLQRAHVLEWIDILVKKGELYEQEAELKAAIRRRRAEGDDANADASSTISEEDVLSPEELKRLTLIRQGVREQDAAIRAQVLASLPPSAQSSPQTVAFLDSMLMPLREYFVASLVCSLLSQVSTSPLPTKDGDTKYINHNASSSRRESSASCSLSQAKIDSMSGSMRENDMIAPPRSSSTDNLHQLPQDYECAFASPKNNSTSTRNVKDGLEDSVVSSSTTDNHSALKKMERVPTTFACHHHAALHAKDLATVHYIETLTPTNPVGLYQFVHAAVGGNADNIIIGDGLGTPGTVKRIQPGTTSMADIAGTTTPGRLITMLKRATNKSKAVPTSAAEAATSSSSLGKGVDAATQGGIPFQSRYGQYHLIYLDDSMDWDDTTFIAAMMPLAESGLAHAQYDIGMCFLSLRETDEACSWLERASKYGHSKAALTLARLHLSMAFEADTIVDKNPSDKSQEVLDAAKVPKKDVASTPAATSLSQIAPNAAASRNKLTVNSGGAINGFAKMDRDTKIRQLTHFHVSKALLWLKKLSQCNWDADTVFKDIPDGEALKAMIERDATALMDARAKKEQDASRRWRLSLRIASLCVFAVALASILAYLVGWLDGSFWDEYEGGGGGADRGLFDSFFPRYMYRSILDGIYGGQYATDPATGKRILLYSSGGVSDADRERSPQHGYVKSKEPSHVRPQDEATHVRRHY